MSIFNREIRSRYTLAWTQQAREIQTYQMAPCVHLVPSQQANLHEGFQQDGVSDRLSDGNFVCFEVMALRGATIRIRV